MKDPDGLRAFEDRLGHRFSDQTLLPQALTHSSVSTLSCTNNERLEFFGDRVLGLVVAEALMIADPKATQGQLTQRFHTLVRKETCAAVGREIDLGSALNMNRAEQMSGGRRKDTVLGDAMEAVIAAVHMDAGFAKARETVLRLWKDRIERVEADPRDAKSLLQEWVQARGQPPPEYVVVDREGSDHAPIFTIRAEIFTGESATAKASSKRAAETAAAKALLGRLG